MNATLETPTPVAPTDQSRPVPEENPAVVVAPHVAEAATDVETPAETVTLAEVDSAAATERANLRERVRTSPHLSRGMRDRLSALLDDASLPTAGQSQPLLRATDAVTLLEEAIPRQLRLDPASVARQEHPDGDAFFSGDPHGISDEQAERIASRQAALSGYARRAEKEG